MGSSRRFATLLVGGIGLALAGPAVAQFSDSFSFLNAVRERDGAKAQPLADKPGASVVNTRDPNTGETPLHIIVKTHDQTWLSFLLQKGALPDLKDKQGNTPLSLAAQTDDVDSARQLLQYRASPNVMNNNGETPLILAVHSRDVGMVRLLLSVGANPKTSDSIAGKSAIDYATEDSRGAPMLKLLNEAKTAKLAPNVAGPTR